MHRLMARGARDERGTALILFTLLLSSGAFLACVALTVDFGNFSSNHSQLQSSADAAALQAAKQCATTGCPSASDLDPISQLNDNDVTHASDLVSSVVALCGHGGGLPSDCGDSTDTASLMHCPSLPSTAGNYAEVITRKRSDFRFRGATSGEPRTGQACAAAAWGQVESVRGVLPLTVPECDFRAVVGSTPTFTSTSPVAVAIDAQHSVCAPAASGGKGWLSSNVTGSCPPPAPSACPCVLSEISVSNPGAGKTSDYSSCLASLIGDVVFLPVYDTSDGGGSGGDYHISGIVGFKLLGIQSPSLKPTTSIGYTSSPGCPSNDVNVSNPKPSPPGNACIWGYFTKGIAPVGTSDPSAPDNGVTVIDTIG